MLIAEKGSLVLLPLHKSHLIPRTLRAHGRPELFHAPESCMPCDGLLLLPISGHLRAAASSGETALGAGLGSVHELFSFWRMGQLEKMPSKSAMYEPLWTAHSPVFHVPFG